MGANDIKELRERTGAGILDCKKALTESNGDVEKAIDWLRSKGIAQAAKKAGRAATEGLVHAYIHAGGKIGVLLEVNCETDFVAMNAGFKELVADIAMHIAASGPEYVSRDEVPPEAIAREKEVQKARVMEEGKPAAVAERTHSPQPSRSPSSSSRSARARNARPRWLMTCFSAGVIWAKVRPSPSSGMKTGS